MALGAVGVDGLSGLETGASTGEVFGGLLMVMTGATLEAIAHTKFSNLASESRAAIASRMSMTSTLRFDARQPMPEFRLAYRF